MHNDSVSQTTRDNASAAQQTSRKSHHKPDPARDREDVPRFRKLMEKSGKGSADETLAAGESPKKMSNEQKLRELLQKQLGEADSRLFAPVQRDGDQGGSGEDQQQDDRGDSSSRAMDLSLGVQMQQQGQQIAQQAVQQPVAHASTTLAPALAELIERHVKQLLMPDVNGASSAHAREIMLSMKDDVLPGTQLWLSRTDKGWRLRADTRSTDSYRTLVEGTPQLIERFANGDLGELEVDPVLLG